MTRPGPAAQARALAARIVTDVVEHQRYLDAALTERLPDAGDQGALVQELSYGVLRRYFELAGIARLFLDRPLKSKDQDVHALLLVGLYQLRYLRVAPHAAVNETVNAATALNKPWARALLNACLRGAQRETARIDATLAADESMRLNHPRWLIDRLRAAYGADADTVFAAANAHPPLTLRVNLARIDRNEYLARLRGAGMEARVTEVSDAGLILAQPVPVERLPGFGEGLVSVQDEAAQLAAPLLDAAPDMRVLDACAAPGGKTGHLLERTLQADLLAVDSEPARVALIAQNLGRLGLRANTIAADAAEPASWWDGRPFDRVLLDAPCSATGVIRRHPDVKLRRRPDDLPRLTAAQARLLDGLWPLLRRGGKLLYVTCSILPDENEQQLAAFLARHDDAAEAALPAYAGRARRHGRQRLPGEQDMDGFYFAAVEKR
jgi:16S rRNA (cytosine967-C5)-methyltransferase